MWKLFFKILLVTFTFYIFNLITFSFFGKSVLIQQILKDTHSSYKEFLWIKKVRILSNLDLNPHEIGLINDFYGGTNSNLEFVEINSLKSKEFENAFFESNIYVHFFYGNSKAWKFEYSIEESEKIDEYYHGYCRTYIWFLFKWIKTDEIFLGIS